MHLPERLYRQHLRGRVWCFSRRRPRWKRREQGAGGRGTAEAVSPFALIEVILYDAAATLPEAVDKLKLRTSSLQTVASRSARTGSGLIVIVTVCALPWHPAALTGTTV